MFFLVFENLECLGIALRMVFEGKYIPSKLETEKQITMLGVA